ncbi:MAG TPA: hypothetical protein VLD35_19705 [Caldimonas sp.]|nr:hypothetical protein [Caldimonas sp.]
MKRRLALLAAGVLIAARAVAADWVIVPGERVGPIDAGASEAKLVELFGAANVKRVSFEVEPGEAVPATTVFADDSTRRAVVLWRDPQARTSPETVLIRGERSVWRTDKGITLGTPLATLRRLNGKALTLTGFGPDLGGTVLDCNGGRLTEFGQDGPRGIVGRTLVVRVEPDPALRDTAAYQQAIGESELSSDSDAMRTLNPRAYELMVEIRPR